MGGCVVVGLWKNYIMRKFYCLGSAPRREVDSQPISPLARPAVRQKHTVWVFCQWQTRPPAVVEW